VQPHETKMRCQATLNEQRPRLVPAADSGVAARRTVSLAVLLLAAAVALTATTPATAFEIAAPMNSRLRTTGEEPGRHTDIGCCTTMRHRHRRLADTSAYPPRWRRRLRRSGCCSVCRCTCWKSGRTSSSLGATSSASTYCDEVDGPYKPRLLKEYWCRRPLLVRNAFDVAEQQQMDAWPTCDEIYELARYNEEDGDVGGESSRLITHVPGQLDSFEAELGPFTASKLDELDNDTDEKKCWTLLVNDVDRYVPELSRWMDDLFAWLPRWRRDDAQVSIARKGGGIGPHVDSYDVFLVQMSGRRSWKIGGRKRRCRGDDDRGAPIISVAEEMDALIPNISVRILGIDEGDGFEYEELILNAGDMLYVPPRVVHWGTATSNDCATLSVGCRAPAAADLAVRLVETMSTSVKAKANQRYTDPDLIEQAGRKDIGNYPSLTDDAKASMKKLVQEAVEEALEDDCLWDDIVGRLTTEPKRYFDDALEPYEDLVEGDEEYRNRWGEKPDDVLEQIAALPGDSGALYPTEGVPFATSIVTTKDGDTFDRMFGYGDMWEVQRKRDDTATDIVTRIVFERIERGKPITGDLVVKSSPELRHLLEEWIREGLLYPSDV